MPAAIVTRFGSAGAGGAAGSRAGSWMGCGWGRSAHRRCRRLGRSHSGGGRGSGHRRGGSAPAPGRLPRGSRTRLRHAPSGVVLPLLFFSGNGEGLPPWRAVRARAAQPTRFRAHTGTGAGMPPLRGWRRHGAAFGCRADCHLITSAPPSAPTATNNPICNGFMLQFSAMG